MPRKGVRSSAGQAKGKGKAKSSKIAVVAAASVAEEKQEEGKTELAVDRSSSDKVRRKRAALHVIPRDVLLLLRHIARRPGDSSVFYRGARFDLNAKASAAGPVALFPPGSSGKASPLPPAAGGDQYTSFIPSSGEPAPEGMLRALSSLRRAQIAAALSARQHVARGAISAGAEVGRAAVAAAEPADADAAPNGPRRGGRGEQRREEERQRG